MIATCLTEVSNDSAFFFFSVPTNSFSPFLSTVCTHILACEGNSKWFFFPGNYAEYEANRKERLGEASIKRITYAPLLNA
jgi:hypothetical protein